MFLWFLQYSKENAARLLDFILRLLKILLFNVTIGNVLR